VNTPGKSSTVGYSGTPLPSKLGLKPGMRFVALNAPPDLDVLLAGAPDFQRVARVTSFECALAFSTSERAAGLVDVKVCAIDAMWSGLKFVRRLRDRRK